MINVPRVTTPEIRQQGLANVAQRIDTPDAMFGDGGKGLMQAADALDKLGARFDARATDEQDEKNAARSLELETMARRETMDRLYNPQTGILTRKGGTALGAQADMAKTMEQIRKKYGAIDGDNQSVKDMVGKQLTGLETSAVETAQRHEFTEFQSFKSDQLTARQTANTEAAALNFNDEKNFSTLWGDNEKALTAQSVQEGWSPEVFKVKKTQLYSTMRAAQITAMVGQDTPDAIIKAKEVFDEAQGRGMLTFDDSVKIDNLLDAALPKAAAQKTYGSLNVQTRTDKADIINYVIDELEGGGKIAKEPNGGIAKFGINSVANPDVDVENLTRDKAVELYGTRYWDAIGGDTLPESLKFIAYDTAVNMGVGTAKELIEKSGGDPKQLIDLRYKEYLRLAKEDPAKYASSLPGWKARLAKLSAQLVSNPNTSQVETAAAELDFQYPGAGAELLALHKSTVDRREATQKAAKTQFLDEIMPVLYANNGDWSQLTAAQKTKAIELDAWKDVTGFNGVTNPAIGTRVANMTADEILGADFTQPEWRLNMSQSDYETLNKKQTDLRQKPSARGEFRTTRDIVSQSWRSMGKPTTDPEYANFQSAVEDAFSSEIEARGGKQLTADDKRVIVSRMVMNTSVGAGWFDGGQKRVYELDPEAQYQISGHDPELVQRSLQVLVSNNIEPTQKNVVSFIENPAGFIKVPGYNEGDISTATQALIRGGLPVNVSTVKSYLERKNRQVQ